MTTHTARMSATPNQTVTAKLFASTGIADTVLYTSSPPVTGQPSNGTSYLPVFSNVIAGTYKIVLYNAVGTVLSDGYGTFTGVDLETVEILSVPNQQTTDAVLTAMGSLASSFAAAAARLALEVQIVGFPAIICRNTDYVTETESEIRLTLVDLTGVAITDIAGTPVADLDWLFGMGSERTPAIIAGAVSWDAETEELVIQLDAADTADQPPGSIAWQIGVSIDDTEDPPNVFTRWLGGGTTRLIERQF